MPKIFFDPYMDRKNGVLKNIEDIKNQDLLDQIEGDFTSIRMKEILDSPIKGKFDFQHLCEVHKYIFQDLFEWAGSPRIINIEKSEAVLGGLSIEYAKYDEICQRAESILSKMNAVKWEKLTLDEKVKTFSDSMAELWKVHPFREGNTRTTITFCCDFAESKGLGLDRNLFKDNSQYMRNALVAASAKFSDIGDYSKPNYLYTIVKDGMERGAELREKQKTVDKDSTMGLSSWRDAVTNSKQSVNYTGRETAYSKNQRDEQDNQRI